MATQKKTQKRNPNAAQVKTITESGATVNVGTAQAKTTETVTVLFRSRISQSFRLSNGKVVTLNGNAVYLANAQGGALPAGGYGVTVLDAADWKRVKEEFGKVYAPWFASGRIKEAKSEAKGVNFAIDHADDKTGNDPVDPVNDAE